MGMVMMSKRELNRLDVLARLPVLFSSRPARPL